MVAVGLRNFTALSQVQRSARARECGAELLVAELVHIELFQLRWKQPDGYTSHGRRGLAQVRVFRWRELLACAARDGLHCHGPQGSINAYGLVGSRGPFWPLARQSQVPKNLVDPASSHMLVSKIKPCMLLLDSPLRE